MITRLIRIRSCFLRHCEGKGHLVWFVSVSPKTDATILAQRKVYIQWKKSKKVQLAVSGYAYLMPWTTLILRCPTRNISKGHIQWLKEGKPLVNHPQFSIKSQGFLKIQQVHPNDAGIYTCTAGSAREHFVLHILGSKKKLTIPEPWLIESGQHKTGLQDKTSTTGTFQELPISLNKYDNVVEHLLELKGYYYNKKYLADKPYSSEKNKLTLENKRTNAESPARAVLVTDSTKLDEIMHNLSEGFGGTQGEHFIMQFLSELAMTQGDVNESTIHPPDGRESSTDRPVFHKPNLKTHTSRDGSPEIIQHPKKVIVSPQSKVVVHVGTPVFLQKPVASLELRCHPVRDPQPAIMWTKNGNPLHFDGRLRGSGKVFSQLRHAQTQNRPHVVKEAVSMVTALTNLVLRRQTAVSQPSFAEDKPAPSVSWPMCGSQFGYAASAHSLQRHKWYSSFIQDVPWSQEAQLSEKLLHRCMLHLLARRAMDTVHGHLWPTRFSVPSGDLQTPSNGQDDTRTPLHVETSAYQLAALQYAVLWQR
ncbi:hypothetical protein XENOCAPTIV_004545 [Xenoophorus captivus]|uniref:Ig-like domain-containing protein n=1 Tax=Xenoophorus captivus TaxID=1517983 RepID=A0ABV0RR09_9TELE